jgi:small GTP-binding protein
MAKNTEKIKELEERIAKTPKNKKTNHAIGLYKAQLAALKEKEVSRGKGQGAATGYEVRKTGDGTVILVGFPSVGKSTLLNSLTNADSEVGAYAFTTLTVVPGLLEYKHAQIQILDVPGIVHGAASGRGRGREVLSCIRSCDLICFVLDINNPEHYEAIKKEVWESHVRVNKEKPDIKIVKTIKGGIDVGSTVRLTKITPDTIKEILKTFRINNADVVLRTDIDADEFIDAVQANKKYIPSITIINKADMATPELIEKAKKELKPDLFISAQKKFNMEKLRELIYKKLKLINIYLKEPGKEADLEVPLIAFKDSSIKDICNKLHKDFIEKFKFARVWGKSAKFPGQRLMLHHKVKDGDILEIHVR